MTKKIYGHDVMALERFFPEVRHMIIFDITGDYCSAGGRGERVRLFLSDEGYKKAQTDQVQGEIKIVEYHQVLQGEVL